MSKSRLLSAAPVIEAGLVALQKAVKDLKAQGIAPHLDVFLVGNHPSSLLYTQKKQEFCQKIGAGCQIIQLDEKIDPQSFSERVKQSTQNAKVHGVLIQLPLPEQLDEVDLAHLVPANKDVDGFHPDNIFKLYSQKKESFSTFLIPCTPKGIFKLLDFYQIDVKNKNVLMIGRSTIVGKPTAMMMLAHNATVTIAHSHTQNLKELCQKADIIVSATGQAESFGSELLREHGNQVLIDVGISKNKQGRVVGDWKHDQIAAKVAAYTPVPGGVGPMTVFMVAENLVLATKLQSR